jgi:alanyl-tRNA synthetase
MSRTEKVFYGEPELLEAEATVIAVEGAAEAPLVELDRTIFYPEGGGQPCDLGSIGGVEVSSVTEERSPAGESRILHALSGPLGALDRVGSRVQLRVDGGRRLDYSQAHTGQHLISATALRLAGSPTVSAHFGRERCAIDLDVPALSEAQVLAVGEAVELAIVEDRGLRTHLCPPEDIASFKLRRKPPEGEEALRVVEIEGLDFTPCCGLHLRSTGELRLVRILGTEKYKGMTRMYFLAGGRAAADYAAVSRIAQEAARCLGASVADLADAALREARRRRELELALGALEKERAALEASSAPEAGSPRPGGEPSLALRRYSDRAAASLMATAKAFAQAGMACLLASIPELTVQALSPEPGTELGSRLKGPLAAAGGRGGGGPSSFRATFPDAASLELFLREAEGVLRGGVTP